MEEICVSTDRIFDLCQVKRRIHCFITTMNDQYLNGHKINVNLEIYLHIHPFLSHLLDRPGKFANTVYSAK